MDDDSTRAARTVEVPPERLSRFWDNLADRHGSFASITVTDAELTVTTEDGTTVRALVPFPPLVVGGGGGVSTGGPLASLGAHAATDRRIGVLLVRLGGHSAGVFEGTALTSSKVGSRLVHGRNKAGGSSANRFARRREGQARVALEAAADVAVRVLIPAAGTLHAVVLGGDRRAVGTVLQDRRLAPLAPLVTEPFLDVPDPRLVVLRATPERFRAVRMTVVDGRS